MSDIKKIKFTSGNEFTLTGGEYIGYYNVKGDKAFVGRDSNELLESLTTPRALVNLGNNFFDRSIYDLDINLRNNLKELLFQPNEIVNKNSINFKLTQLYENFLDIFRNTLISSPGIPENLTSVGFVSGEDPGVGYKILLDTNPLNTSVNYALSTGGLFNFNNYFRPEAPIQINTLKGKSELDYTLFLSVSGGIFTFKVPFNPTGDSLGLNTLTFVTSTVKLGPYETIEFKNIISVQDNNNDTLFLADSGAHSIYKLNVSNIVNDDRTGYKTPEIKEILGGFGDDDLNFKGLRDILFLNNHIYTLDTVKSDLKKFTSNFKFLLKYKNTKFFKNENIVNISGDSINNKIYILTENYTVRVIDGNNFTELDIFKFNKNNFQIGEKAKKLFFSKNNSNIYYLLTNFGVYKYLKNRKNILIAKFDFSNLVISSLPPNLQSSPTWDTVATNWNAYGDLGSATEWQGIPTGAQAFSFQDMDILPSDLDIDNICGVGNNKITFFKESDNFLSFLSNENQPFYSLNEILFSTEYFNNLTLNTSLYKLLYNHKILSLNLNKKIESEYDFYTQNLKLKQILNFSSLRDDEIGNLYNFYAGLNEVVSVNIFNRIIESIYNYQDKIINSIQTEINNTPIPALSTITF